ncbi:DUF4199 family protein [Winogradskyella sp. 3972H.M.0a.05]|uniref:DUF4199 domain-containing protein n=1 Tax=Winogradskyella sp. 3972H.M.0a.05 TaxID=2950277 RepID=UPI0033930EAB
MKNSVLKYGFYGLLTAVVLFLLALWLGKGLSYTTQEVLGYTTMVASLSFIFFGVKHYRDKVNNGSVSFGKALVIGLLISAFVGLGIGIGDYIYTTSINPDFMTEYMDYTLKGMEETLSPEEFAVKKAELEQQMEIMGRPIMLAVVMFATVFVIGLIISLISALILQRK